MDTNSPWNNIPEDKKTKILEASIEEFANKGYINASTNEIIKKAGISKGLLFHYFGNKRNLYLTTLDLITNEFFERFYEVLHDDSNDIFNKLLNWNKTKFTLLSEYPTEYKMLMGAYVNVPQEIKDELVLRYNHLSKISISNFLKDVDYSMFRKNLDQEKAVELILLTLDSIGNKYIQQYKGKEDEIIKELPKITKEIQEYLYMLRVGLYPEDGAN